MNGPQARRWTCARIRAPFNILTPHIILIVDLIIHRGPILKPHFPGQDGFHMQDELLVILGAEATILVFVAAMTLYARRMDILSGRSFERSVVSPTGNGHPLRSIRRKQRDLLRLIRRWGGLTTFAFAPLNLLRRPDIARTLQWSVQTRPQTLSRRAMRFRRSGTPAADASGRPALLSEAVRNADAQG
ncbi:hypothetical protein [Bradyrhizobium sp. AC87j1]|uniref:hypothetical protein n=1 Tax=Bradyrhizobium sp. AC87j1 TaxID=2055894 RepID=UPI0011AFF8B4|nr:hypothetical protein [Bradyrhizobium sp. AC87j1]